MKKIIQKNLTIIIFTILLCWGISLIVPWFIFHIAIIVAISFQVVITIVELIDNKNDPYNFR